MIFPGGTSRYLVRAMQEYFSTLHREGTTASMQRSMLDFNQLNDVIGTRELLDAAKAYE